MNADMHTNMGLVRVFTNNIFSMSFLFFTLNIKEIVISIMIVLSRQTIITLGKVKNIIILIL